MTELVRLIWELASTLVPFRLVRQWEHGVYFWCGRYQFTAHPGLLVVVPYLCDVKCVSMVPEIETTPLQTVTMRDGRTITYSASLTIKVVDAAAAYNRVGHWSETTVELAAGVISEHFGDEDPVRIVDPSRGKRDNVLEEVREEINKKLADYGVVVEAIRLNNFVLNVRTVRLLLNNATIMDKAVHQTPS